jgi:hypothetical protein
MLCKFLYTAVLANASWHFVRKKEIDQNDKYAGNWPEVGSLDELTSWGTMNSVLVHQLVH